MRVYRLENAKGVGVFACNKIHDYDESRVSGVSPYEMPCAFREPSNTALHKAWFDGELNSFRFAFTSLRQLESVFSCRVGRRAISDTIRVNVYEVPENQVFTGNSQCIYVHDCAELVDTLDVETLEKEKEYA